MHKLSLFFEKKKIPTIKFVDSTLDHLIHFVLLVFPSSLEENRFRNSAKNFIRKALLRNMLSQDCLYHVPVPVITA